MPALIVNGREIYKNILEEVRREIERFRSIGYRIKLGIISIGDDREMQIYIRNKKIAADFCGIEVVERNLPYDVQESDLISHIYEFNNSPDISGFIVQLPLPSHIRKEVLDLISPLKDVDCLTSENLGMVMKDHNSARFVPCASMSMIEIFRIYDISPLGKNAVVVGASDLVGKPCASILVNMGATVTICHKNTDEKVLEQSIKNADIVVSAVGKPGLIKGEWIKDGAVVIDIGTRAVDGKLVGDVEFEKAKERAGIITPVPGGVGIITVAELMRNTLKAFSYSISAIGSPSATEPPS